MASKKWYSTNLSASTREGLETCEKFKEFLHDTVDKFETSGCFDLLHFEIEATPHEADLINNWLYLNIYSDAITERRT